MCFIRKINENSYSSYKLTAINFNKAVVHLLLNFNDFCIEKSQKCLPCIHLSLPQFLNILRIDPFLKYMHYAALNVIEKTNCFIYSSGTFSLLPSSITSWFSLFVFAYLQYETVSVPSVHFNRLTSMYLTQVICICVLKEQVIYPDHFSFSDKSILHYLLSFFHSLSAISGSKYRQGIQTDIVSSKHHRRDNVWGSNAVALSNNQYNSSLFGF